MKTQKIRVRKEVYYRQSGLAILCALCFATKTIPCSFHLRNAFRNAFDICWTFSGLGLESLILQLIFFAFQLLSSSSSLSWSETFIKITQKQKQKATQTISKKERKSKQRKEKLFNLHVWQWWDMTSPRHDTNICLSSFIFLCITIQHNTIRSYLYIWDKRR